MHTRDNKTNHVKTKLRPETVEMLRIRLLVSKGWVSRSTEVSTTACVSSLSEISIFSTSSRKRQPLSTQNKSHYFTGISTPLLCWPFIPTQRACPRNAPLPPRLFSGESQHHRPSFLGVISWQRMFPERTCSWSRSCLTSQCLTFSPTARQDALDGRRVAVFVYLDVVPELPAELRYSAYSANHL